MQVLSCGFVHVVGQPADRIGGRVWTRDFGDGIVEVGAEWFHGTVDNRLYELMIANHLEMKVQDLVTELLQADGTRAPVVLKELVDKGMELAFEYQGEGVLGEAVIKQLDSYIETKHPEVQNDTALRQQVVTLVEMSVNSYEASSSWLDVNAASQYETLDGHQHASAHRLGYRTVFDLLLKKHNNGPGLPTLDIKLNSEVTNIEWPRTPDKPVVVSCGANKYTARNAIVTVSLGVLKERYSSLFTPPLPADKQTAIQQLAMGSIGKIIFSFEKPWWIRNQWYDLIWKQEEVEALPESHRWVAAVAGVSTPMGSDNTLTLWTWGPTSKLVETLPEEEVKNQAMSLLRRFFSATANGTIADPTGFLRSTWYANPFTRGTYSYDSISAPLSARGTLSAPLEDSSGAPRLLFAGEASHETRYSTVHGASETGVREAKRLLKN